MERFFRFFLRNKKNRTAHSSEMQNVPEEFQGIQSPELQAFLIKFSKRIKTAIPMLPNSNVLNAIASESSSIGHQSVHKISEHLRLKGFLPFSYQKTSKSEQGVHFSREAALAFASMAWAKDTLESKSPNKKRARWNEVAEKAKEGLGNNHIAEQISIPD